MFKLDRRTVLRGMLGGTAITVALPLLDCFLACAGGKACQWKRRLPVCWMCSEGGSDAAQLGEAEAAGKRRRQERTGGGALFQVLWHRVVLDEAQSIKNPRTLVSHAAACLQVRAPSAAPLADDPPPKPSRGLTAIS